MTGSDIVLDLTTFDLVLIKELSLQLAVEVSGYYTYVGASFNVLTQVLFFEKPNYRDSTGLEADCLVSFAVALTARFLIKLILHFGHVPRDFDSMSACMGHT